MESVGWALETYLNARAVRPGDSDASNDDDLTPETPESDGLTGLQKLALLSLAAVPLAAWPSTPK